MKTYEVELRCTGYVTITVEAGNAEEAEFIAWQECAAAKADVNWDIESIEEIKHG